jgi:hypothetical protein
MGRAAPHGGRGAPHRRQSEGTPVIRRGVSDPLNSLPTLVEQTTLLLLLVVCVPFVILIVGTPIALVMRLVVEVLSRL